jgi:hypothetical protein
MIHIFGDSHSQYPYNQIVTTPYQIHYYEGITMKRLGYPEEQSIPNWYSEIHPPDTVILVCGEIDIRVWAHVHETERKKVPAVFLVDWVNRYLNKITEGHVYVQSIAPPGRGDKIRALGCAKGKPQACAEKTCMPCYRFNWPVSGSDAARASYTAIANSALATGCQARGLHYLDVYSRYVDSEGMLDLSCTEDHVHISSPTAMRELLAAEGLTP